MNTGLDALATPEEVLEAELAVIQSHGLVVEHIGYQRFDEVGVHLYNLVTPQLPGYDYEDGNLPTFTFEGLKSLRLI